MKQDRMLKIAKRYNILENIHKLEKELLSIERVTEVEFDLDGFLDNMGQVIFLTKYDIPVETEDYFKVRRKLLVDVIKVAQDNGLSRTEDRIEDYGTWFYFVFKHNDDWKINMEEVKC